MKTLALLLLSCVAVSAQSLTGEALVKALQSGGNVIVMRHASSPREVPDKAAANPDNTKLERQLDDIGRNTATTMGRAIRGLKIPIGAVLASPTYRALETARYAQLPNPETTPELGENAASMSGGTAAQAAWLKTRVTQAPLVTNDFLITHQPNIAAAFPGIAVVNEGDALIFHDGQMIARIAINSWPALAKAAQ
ncbi:MAG: histidine phosphatase family protein [Acidobacteriota bacterium]